MKSAPCMTEQPRSVAEVLCENDIVLIDTNVLMDESHDTELFFLDLCGSIARTGRQICLLEEVLLEIYSHLDGSASKATPVSRQRARLADRRVRLLLQNGQARVLCRDQQQGFFDASVISLWLQDVQRRLALLTSDNNLANDLVEKLTRLEPVNGRAIQCYKVCDLGHVVHFRGVPRPAAAGGAAPKKTWHSIDSI